MVQEVPGGGMISFGMCVSLGHATRLLPTSDSARVATVLSCLCGIIRDASRPPLSAVGACIACGALLSRIGCDDDCGTAANALALLCETAFGCDKDAMRMNGAWLGLALAAHMPVRSAPARVALRALLDRAYNFACERSSARAACPAWLAIGSLTVACVVADIMCVPDAKDVIVHGTACLEWDEFCCIALPGMLSDFAVCDTRRACIAVACNGCGNRRVFLGLISAVLATFLRA